MEIAPNNPKSNSLPPFVDTVRQVGAPRAFSSGRSHTQWVGYSLFGYDGKFP